VRERERDRRREREKGEREREKIERERKERKKTRAGNQWQLLWQTAAATICRLINRLEREIEKLNKYVQETFSFVLQN